MNKPPDLHRSLIRALGGLARLADDMDLPRDALSKWPARGIPAKYWHIVSGLAARLEPPVVVTANDLAATKPASAEAAL